MPQPDANMISQMRKGVLEYFILLLLSTGKAYSSDIIARLKEAGLIIVDGTLYTLLNRLRREGKLDYIWEESKQGPPRKYYFITDHGKETGNAMSEAWDQIADSVNRMRLIMNLNHPGGIRETTSKN